MSTDETKRHHNIVKVYLEYTNTHIFTRKSKTLSIKFKLFYIAAFLWEKKLHTRPICFELEYY